MALTEEEKTILDSRPENGEYFWTSARRKRLSTILEKLGVGLFAAPLVQVLTKKSLEMSSHVVLLCISAVALLLFSIAANPED
jgi:hypothetical protein